MEPFERSRSPYSQRPRTTGTPSTTPPLAGGADPFEVAAPPPAAIRLDAPALLVEAWFRDTPLATRLLPAGTATPPFTIGAGREAEAPVNPAYLGGTVHELVAADPAGGFVVSLAPPMRVELETETQRLPLPPDLGTPEAPLALPPHAALRVLCGEMTYAIRATAAAAPLPRPVLPADWRRDGVYGLGVLVVALLGLVAILFMPQDPKSLAFDIIGASGRLPTIRITPPVVPTLDSGGSPAGGPNAPKAAGASGQAGDRTSHAVARRMAIKRTSDLELRLASREAAINDIRSRGILGQLRAREGSPLADVLSSGPINGMEAENALGDLVSTTLGNAYGVGGLDSIGTGSGGGGTGQHTLGGSGGLRTLGGKGVGDGTGDGYGTGVGNLRTHHAMVPRFIPGDANVRGALDRDTIRRIVRRHINEVRYCYEQALVTRPTLAGRLSVGFTIAGSGQVISSVLQSSTLGAGATAAESCIVNAVRRWEFPRPEGGGIVIVSYPFQLTPAGG
jgi:hypothetical protein